MSSTIFGLQSSYILEYRWLFALFLRSARCFTGAEGKWTLLSHISPPSLPNYCNIDYVFDWLFLTTDWKNSSCHIHVAYDTIFRAGKVNQTTGSLLLHPHWVKSLMWSLTTCANPFLIHLNIIYSFIYHFIYFNNIVDQTLIPKSLCLL